jgi:hypothetical protein
MRRRVEHALLLGLALAAGTASATIDSVKTCTTWGGNRAVIGRGTTDLTVTGFGVDLATSVKTTLPNTTLIVVSRKNGFGSNIVLRFSTPDTGNAAVGVVTLGYFGGGTDVFDVSLVAGPSVTSIAFAPGGGVSTSGGTVRVTSVDPHVIVLKGTNLDALDLLGPAYIQTPLQNLEVVLQLPGELRVSFTSSAGDRSVGRELFTGGDPCSSHMLPFSFAFTVFDPPRTPTPTATTTPTKTATPFPFHPISLTPGLPGAFPTPTPTPTRTPFPLLLPPKR